VRIRVACFAAFLAAIAVGGCGGDKGGEAEPSTTQSSTARAPASRAATPAEGVWLGGLAVIVNRNSSALQELTTITNDARDRLLGGDTATALDAEIAITYLQTCGDDIRKLGRPPTPRTRRMASLFSAGCQRFRSGGQVAFSAIRDHDGDAWTAGLIELSKGLPYTDAALKLGPRKAR
jgi:hypothetical protein